MKNFFKNLDWSGIIKTSIIIAVVCAILGGYSIYVALSKHSINVTIVGVGSVTGNGKYKLNEEVVLTAQPIGENVFIGWYYEDYTDPENKISEELTLTVNMPSEDVTYIAVFNPKP